MKNLVLACTAIFISHLCYCQETKKVIIKSKDFIEEFDVLVSNKKIREGDYKKIKRSGELIAEGKYASSTKIGEWKYYVNGNLEQVYDYSSNELKSVNKPNYLIKSIVDGEPKEIQLDTPPLYIGGSDNLSLALFKIVRYPIQAQRMGIEGQCILQFWINEDNSISEVELLKHFDSSCDQEALRSIKEVKEGWLAGTKDGKKVKSQVKILFQFSLNELGGSGRPSVRADIF